MERQLPKNVRQIGNVSDTPKVYVEDYVDTYLNQLKEKAKDQPVGMILAGEMTDFGEEKVVFVSGAVQLRELGAEGTRLEITEEVLESAKEEMDTFFPECQIVGWGIVEDGNPLSRNREVKRIQEKEFSSEMSLFLWKNAREQEEIFYAYKFGEMMQLGGYYIYYEKNPQMQNYMINNRKTNGVTPSEVVEDRAAKDFRSAVREKMENRSRENRKPVIAYITSALLVLIVFVAGFTTVQSFGKMKAMQDSVESLSKTVGNSEKNETTETATVNKTQEKGKSTSETVKKTDETKTSDKAEAQLTEQDYYVVQKGETLAGISKKLYGDATHVKAICKMNGLSDGNLIYIGQKLLLP